MFIVLNMHQYPDIMSVAKLHARVIHDPYSKDSKVPIVLCTTQVAIPIYHFQQNP